MSDGLSMEDIARRVAEADEDGTLPPLDDEPGEETRDSSPPESGPSPAPAPEPEPEKRTRKKRVPRPRPEAPPEPPPAAARPATTAAEAGIAMSDDPTHPFPAQVDSSTPSNDRVMRIYTARDDVPPDESDPLMRDGVTYEEIEPSDGMQFPDQSGSGRRAPANLTDVCREYRIGPGEHDCYIRVERKEPKVWQGVSTVGLLGNLRYPLTEGEFKNIVGGGKYELVVYGPDPRGTKNPFSGTVEIKALTKPIVAWHPGRPRFVSDIEQQLEQYQRDESDGDDMQGGMGWNPLEGRRTMIGARGEVTTADAKIHQDSLTFAQKELEAQRRENKELRTENAQRNVNDPNATTAVVKAIGESAKVGVDAVKETAESTKAMLERQLQQRDELISELRAEVREMRTQMNSAPRTDPNQSTITAITELSKTMIQQSARGEPGTSLQEVTRLQDQHMREVTRMQETHAREMEQTRLRYEELSRARETENERQRTYYLERERQLRDDYERREASLKSEYERREAALEQRHKDTLDRMREEHRREIEWMKRQEDLVRETHKTSYETRIAAADERVKSAEKEAERARKLAEEKDDFAAQMEKISETAELLGYSKGDDTPKDWKSQLVASIGAALENAPAIAEKVSLTFAARAEAAQAQVHAMRMAAGGGPTRALPPQQRPPMPPGPRPGAPQAQRRFWASEEGAPIGGHVRPTEPDVRPDQRPPPVGGAPVVEPQAPLGPAPAYQADGDWNARQGKPAEPPPPLTDPTGPPPAAQPHSAAPPPPPQARPLPIPPAMLNQLRQMLEASFQAGAPPVDFAQALVGEIGPVQARQIIHSLDPDAVLAALSEDPNAASSPLLARDGRRWFKDVWAAGAQLVA